MTNLDTGEAATTSAFQPFSSQRIVVSSFNPANETIQAAVQSLGVKKGLGSLNVAIQQMEGMEGGLSDIEKRALRDLGEMIGAKKVHLIEDDQPVTNDQLLAMLKR